MLDNHNIVLTKTYQVEEVVCRIPFVMQTIRFPHLES